MDKTTFFKAVFFYDAVWNGSSYTDHGALRAGVYDKKMKFEQLISRVYLMEQIDRSRFELKLYTIIKKYPEDGIMRLPILDDEDVEFIAVDKNPSLVYVDKSTVRIYVEKVERTADNALVKNQTEVEVKRFKRVFGIADQLRSPYRFFMEWYEKQCKDENPIDVDRRGFEIWKSMKEKEKERYVIQAEEVDSAYENAMSKEFAKSVEMDNEEHSIKS